MHLKVSINGEKQWIYPEENWKNLDLKTQKTNFKIDANFYVFSENK